jgi:NAD(P)-dependent dehydrogenase (short-subunit alcohol dehydrogenase family)
MATALVQNGARVIIASRKEKALKEVADQLNSASKSAGGGGGSCEYIVADLGSKAGCEALAAEIRKKTDKVHLLVNNSGVTWGARYEDVDEKKGWDQVYGAPRFLPACQPSVTLIGVHHATALNVKSIFFMTVALTPLLEKGANNLGEALLLLRSRNLSI